LHAVARQQKRRAKESNRDQFKKNPFIDEVLINMSKY